MGTWRKRVYYFQSILVVFVCQAPEDSGSYLWAGENDGFAQMFTHEGQGRGRVSHSVCAMQDHKTIKVFIVFLETDKKKGWSEWQNHIKCSPTYYINIDPAANTSMSFPILPQSSVVILEESSKGLYSITVYIILLLSLLSLEERDLFIIVGLSMRFYHYIHRLIIISTETKAEQKQPKVNQWF